LAHWFAAILTRKVDLFFMLEFTSMLTLTVILEKLGKVFQGLPFPFVDLVWVYAVLVAI